MKVWIIFCIIAFVSLAIGHQGGLWLLDEIGHRAFYLPWFTGLIAGYFMQYLK